MRTRRIAIAALALVALAAGCSSGSTSTKADGTSTPSGGTAGGGATTGTAAPAEDLYPGYTSTQYAGDTNWLCRPGKAESPCDSNLDVTVVKSDGTMTVKPFAGNPDAPIDCFYVYPTISGDKGANSDLSAGDEERNAVENQAAQFGSVCKVYAPVYRQIPLAALTAALGGSAAATTTTATSGPTPGEIAYGDVLDAFKQYMAHDNKGRGVVLIGHSQGSGHLIHLIKDEIDPKPAARARLVSALLLGAPVAVPAGGDVGGDFANIPLCRSTDQVGCAINYSSFRSTAPPPANSFFGKPRTGDGEAGCTNPAALAGGSGSLTAIFPTAARPWLQDATKAATITTKWVELPGLLTAACQKRDPFNYLEVTVHPDASDQRATDIPGDITPPWGLHLVDANIAMGNLVDLVGQQSSAYVKAH